MRRVTFRATGSNCGALMTTAGWRPSCTTSVAVGRADQRLTTRARASRAHRGAITIAKRNRTFTSRVRRRVTPPRKPLNHSLHRSSPLISLHTGRREKGIKGYADVRCARLNHALASGLQQLHVVGAPRAQVANGEMVPETEIDSPDAVSSGRLPVRVVCVDLEAG